MPNRMLNRSPLVRQLMAAGAETPPPGATLAEQLSPWLTWTDAIALSQVLAPTMGLRAAPQTASTPASAASLPALQAALDTLRAELAQAIVDMDLGTADEEAPWRQLWQVQQQTMAARIAPLRTHLRSQLRHAARQQGQALAPNLTPNLALLADIDAVLETTLATRERSLLGALPRWLQRQAAADAPHRARGLMQAELALRLQPLEGLLAALAAATPAPHPA
jgi:hypothetical protein